MPADTGKHADGILVAVFFNQFIDIKGLFDDAIDLVLGKIIQGGI